MATKSAPAGQGDLAADVEVRVLFDCTYGKCNDVAKVPGVEIANAKADGLVDDTPEAVAYARSLQQPAAV